MRFLADAHISHAIVDTLRVIGHDCLDSSAIPPRTPDDSVLRFAAADDRIVLTADKDFGELVFVHRIACPGVVLVRVSFTTELDRAEQVREAWPEVLRHLPGAFVTIADLGVRARPIP